MSETGTPQGAGSGNPPPGTVTTTTVTPASHAAHTTTTRSTRESSIGRVFRFLFAPFIWLARPLVFRITKERGTPKVYFTSFSTLMYLWPIMIIGWAGPWIAENIHPDKLDTMGWVWLTIVWVVILSIGADMDRNKVLALLGIIIILWLGGMLLEAKKGIPILSNIYDYFANQGVVFQPGTARVFGIITTIMLLFVVISAWFDGRYEITTREITHRRVFRTSDSVPRAAKRIKQDWRDVSEFILGIGAGDLIVQDSHGNVVLRIPNVPFLWFFRHDVDHILEVLATTDVDDVEAAIAEADDAG